MIILAGADRPKTRRTIKFEGFGNNIKGDECISVDLKMRK